MKRVYLIVGGILLLAVTLWIGISAGTQRDAWTETEITTLRSLWIGSLPPLPPDPSNAYADDPRAAALGQRLFFDTRFGSNGAVACATCHVPGLMFTDKLPLAHGVGTTNRKTMTIVGTAYSPWQFWDGRKDSQWAQALGPLESPVEHGGTRTQYVHLIDELYRADYEAIFGDLPDFSDRARFPDAAGPVDDESARAAWEAMSPEDRAAVTRVYVNTGKAIAAYERLIMPGPSRFDQYVEALLNDDQEAMQTALTRDEVAGMRLFIGQAQCIKCHNGPLFTNNDFHNTGVPTAAGLPVDDGRASGVQKVLSDEFNCLSQWSDAGENDCAELRYVTVEGEALLGAFKPPTLRNVAETGPYMHAGQFTTLKEVIQHYNTAPPGPIGHTELEPLRLTPAQQEQLEAFLRALSGPLPLSPEYLQAPR
jgi:cytochrome c peroxidase